MFVFKSFNVNVAESDIGVHARHISVGFWTGPDIPREAKLHVLSFVCKHIKFGGYTNTKYNIKENNNTRQSNRYRVRAALIQSIII